MLFARVVGTVWSTQKDEKLGAFKFLLLKQLDQKNQPVNAYVVAVDAVGAGVGEVVLYATGSSARQTKQTEGKPVDATIIAIVDSWDVDGEIVFRKDEAT
ncbi:MAG: EutN/CcmL family microcompartment protein [Planctomycetes bacterium]|nr:EutN/CcmL family microcompartment protein [Planctomycetota bacterium]MBI3845751.1 EutN/CcmL family microcompartment protein [Planctomycetota bacterium]